MNTLSKAVTSRTVWTFIVLFVVSGTQGIHGLIPAEALPYVDGVLSLLGIYFKLNPSQAY